MITRISGRLEELRSASAVVSTGGGLWYEVMIPSCDAGYFNGRVGEQVNGEMGESLLGVMPGVR